MKKPIVWLKTLKSINVKEVRNYEVDATHGRSLTLKYQERWK
ncbi:MAG: hypothetical protein ACOCXH_13050 [Cyclobacteriaceae bacterium]